MSLNDLLVCWKGFVRKSEESHRTINNQCVLNTATIHYTLVSFRVNFRHQYGKTHFKGVSKAVLIEVKMISSPPHGHLGHIQRD